MKLLTLCIPTNGVSEWVFPVLDSIYCQKVDEELFEVVITDNGNNVEFENRILQFVSMHSNVIYQKTTAIEFMNQVEAFNLANGEFVKFINHRNKLLPGKLEKMVSLVERYKDTKPIMFFSNGNLPFEKEREETNGFDEFVRKLSYYSSWSGGLCFWKSDYDNTKRREQYNKLFPHINILFEKKDREHYIIDNDRIFEEIPVNGIAKGRYALFHAFAVEYVAIILELYRGGYITLNTFKVVKSENLKFIASLYYDYVIRKRECSYDLTNAKEYITTFYSAYELKRAVVGEIMNRLLNKFR